LKIAAVAHPGFKEAWIENVIIREKTINLYKNTVKNFYENYVTKSKNDNTKVHENQDKTPVSNFFSFMAVNSNETVSSVDNELNIYFICSRSKLESFLHFSKYLTSNYMT